MNKLEKLLEYSKIPKHQNGAAIKKIEVSEQPNVLPTGDLHKNKHDDFGIDVTEKGIPVITVKDDTVETLPEIQQQADSIKQHAEVEKEEVIFNKQLTDDVEEARKKWNDSEQKDDSICIEMGKRIVKELLFNTIDRDKLINKIEENN